jgi:hypothetical protein
MRHLIDHTGYFRDVLERVWLIPYKTRRDVVTIVVLSCKGEIPHFVVQQNLVQGSRLNFETC